MSQIICPYCFEKYNSSEFQLRCIGSGCPKEEDRELSRYWRGTKIDKPVIKPDIPFYKKIQNKLFSEPLNAICPKCNEKTSKRICPFCHNELPYSIGQSKEYIISLIGAKQAGKSNYIAVLIHQLRGIVGHKIEASLHSLEDRTTRRYNEEFYNPLFNKKEVIQATTSAIAERKHPLLFNINIKKRSFSGLMVFFDTAGEDLDNTDIMRSEINYITNSTGIILLLDPLQIPAVRDRLPKNTILPMEHTHPEEILSRVINIIREKHELPEKQLIKIPLALSFSKIDALHSILPPDSALNRASTHDDKFDIDDCELVSSEIQAYLHEWIGPELNNLVENNFEHFAYFGISALGGSPDENGKLTEEVSPFRTEDPIFWLLWKNKIIKGRTNIH
jgi:hypothetical protein